MPIKRCFVDGKPGFKWGNKGKCYTYNPGKSDERQEALLKASRQGKAIETKGDKDV